MTALFIAQAQKTITLQREGKLNPKEKNKGCAMDSGFFTFFLPLTLAVMMMGLGLQLTPKRLYSGQSIS